MATPFSRPRRRVVFVLAGVLALLAGVVALYQHFALFRLTKDPNDSRYFGVVGDMAIHHDCTSGYFTAILLAKEGVDYLELPRKDFVAKVVSRSGLSRDTPPVNPPPALLPYSALAKIERTELSRDFLRQHVFFAQVLLGVIGLGWCAWRLSAEMPALPFLVPFFFLSSPWRENVHIGQSQLFMAIAVVIGAVAAATGRNKTGGVALGFATMTHVHPGIVFLTLLVRRRWPAIVAGLLTAVVLIALSVVVFGKEMVSTYFFHVLPDYFIHGDQGELKTTPAWVTVQISPWGFVMKLALLGLPVGSPLGYGLCRLLLVVVVVVAVLVGRREKRSPAEESLAFIALVVLALYTNAWMHPYGLLLPTILGFFTVARALGDGVSIRWMTVATAAAATAFLGYHQFFPSGVGEHGKLEILVALVELPAVLYLCVLAFLPYRHSDRRAPHAERGASRSYVSGALVDGQASESTRLT